MTKTHFGWLLAAALLPSLASAEEAQVRVTATLVTPTCITTIGDAGATRSDQKNYNLNFGALSGFNRSASKVKKDEKRFRLFISGCNISPGGVTTTIPETDRSGLMIPLETQPKVRFANFYIYLGTIDEQGSASYYYGYRPEWKPFEIAQGFREFVTAIVCDGDGIFSGTFTGNFSLVTTYE